MIGAMDLNASPLPEEDEDTFERHIEEYATQERIESGAEILRRVLLSQSFSAFFFSFLCRTVFNECIFFFVFHTCPFLLEV